MRNEVRGLLYCNVAFVRENLIAAIRNTGVNLYHAGAVVGR